MKIEPSFGLSEIKTTRPVSFTTGKAESFSALFEKARKESDSISSPTSPSILSDSTAVSFHGLYRHNDLIGQMSSFTNILEEYAVKLGRTDIRIEEIRPLVQSLRNFSIGLTSKINLSEHDEGMMAVLNDLIQTANAEISRFERGDYGDC